jgi:hypothetical protein
MTRFALLSSGLVPALLVLTIRAFHSNRLASAILFIASLALTVMLARAMAARDTINPQPFAVEAIEDESVQVPAYIVTYVVPFLFLSINGSADLIACIVFAFFVLVLVYRTDLALVNPLLLIAGFHLFRLHTTAGNYLILIAKTRPLPGQTISAVKLSEKLYKLRHVVD